MLNQFVTVGRINEINKDSDNNVYLKFDVKNNDGSSNILEARLTGAIAENTIKYCQINDMIGIKGSLVNENDNLIIQAEKLTFLSSKKENEEEKER